MRVSVVEEGAHAWRHNDMICKARLSKKIIIFVAKVIAF